MEVITFDIEANSLLNEEVIDYLASPYKLTSKFNLHCLVVEEHRTGKIIAFFDGEEYILDGRRYRNQVDGYDYFLHDYEPVEYEHRPLSEFKDYVKSNVGKVVAHNGINYDLMVCKLYLGMDYEINPDTWDGKVVEIEDTLVTSKTLNPDRFGGHSLDNLGKIVGTRKVEFRKHIPENIRFDYWYADMLYYCIWDVKVNTKVYQWLETQKAGWNWDNALTLEKSVMEIITRQEHRGFWFDKDLAARNIEELDLMLEERRVKIEPLLPPRKPTRKFLSDNTPPVNQYKDIVVVAPEKQFTKAMKLNANFEKFITKHGGTFDLESRTCNLFGKEYSLPIEAGTELYKERVISTPMENFLERVDGKISKDSQKVKIDGKIYTLPLEVKPYKEEMVATVGDTTHIKEWLVGMGWNPSEWKDRDITVNAKKVKLEDDKFEQAVKKYVEQTLESSFCAERCEFLNTTPANLYFTLMKKDRKRSIKVLTNPSFTIGQEKEMCPNLEKLFDVFPYTKDLVEYLTFKHRRNSILGGGYGIDDEEEADKGYLASVREDGRIPTPADTCGAATSRFKHRLVANIPRVTSLFGDKMRAMFGVSNDFYQIGYDFDSLEAKEEASYCWRYEDENKEYCNSLTLEKPNDVHSVLARKISGIIGREFARSPAKSTKYAATYGATPPKVAKTIGESLAVGEMVYEAFWEAAKPLALLKEALKRYWENTGNKQFILGIDGRKVPTRSPHAILNSLFQSAGVICAKRAMVIHDRLLKERGLTVDFFKDDWKSKKFAQQLIAYHDEAQLEVSKSMVMFKTLRIPDLSGKNQEEIKQILKDLEVQMQNIKSEVEKESGLVWSDVSHTEKMFYIAYSEAGALATEAVNKAGEYYKLNVPLTAGYIVGRNWKECH